MIEVYDLVIFDDLYKINKFEIFILCIFKAIILLLIMKTYGVNGY